jgi:predicted nucleotidyltransferase
MRIGQELCIVLNDVTKTFEVDEVVAGQIIQALLDEGYLLLDPDERYHERWLNTIKGNALANASAAKPVKRAVAEKHLLLFLKRVEHVNASNQYAYRVSKVVVFGSYLSDSSDLGDVDIAVELTAATSNSAELSRLLDSRRKVAIMEGRSFKSTFDEIIWPVQEVLLYLKSGSRIINLHRIEDDVLELPQTVQKVLYEDAKVEDR